MKDFTEAQFRNGRPDIHAKESIKFCLDRIFEDAKHGINNEIVKGLDFEELIGTLLLAETEIKVLNGELS